MQSLGVGLADLHTVVLDIACRYMLLQDHGDDIQTLSSEYKIIVRSGDVCKGCRGEQQWLSMRARGQKISIYGYLSHCAQAPWLHAKVSHACRWPGHQVVSAQHWKRVFRSVVVMLFSGEKASG